MCEFVLGCLHELRHFVDSSREVDILAFPIEKENIIKVIKKQHKKASIVCFFNNKFLYFYIVVNQRRKTKEIPGLVKLMSEIRTV